MNNPSDLTMYDQHEAGPSDLHSRTLHHEMNGHLDKSIEHDLNMSSYIPRPIGQEDSQYMSNSQFLHDAEQLNHS